MAVREVRDSVVVGCVGVYWMNRSRSTKGSEGGGRGSKGKSGKRAAADHWV